VRDSRGVIYEFAFTPSIVRMLGKRRLNSETGIRIFKAALAAAAKCPEVSGIKHLYRRLGQPSGAVNPSSDCATRTRIDRFRDPTPIPGRPSGTWVQNKCGFPCLTYRVHYPSGAHLIDIERRGAGESGAGN
jgi:hypothetical protein